MCFVSFNTIAQDKHFDDGTTELVKDNSYAANTNWDQLFSDFDTKVVGRDVGSYRKIVVAPDGSIFMSQKTVHELWKFDPNGNLNT